MREHQLAGHIVIQHSEIDYHQPVVSDYTACCRLPDDGRFERFIRIYQRKAIARLQLDVNIDIETGTAVSFSGDYVVHG